MTGAGVQLFKHNRTQPEWRVSSYPPEGKRCFVSPAERGYIYGRIEECRLNLTNQVAVDILDLNTALDEMLSSLLDKAVLLVFRDREIQRSLNGLSLRLGVQSSLGALDLGSVQQKVFVGSLSCRRHANCPPVVQVYRDVNVIDIHVHQRGLHLLR